MTRRNIAPATVRPATIADLPSLWDMLLSPPECAMATPAIVAMGRGGTSLGGSLIMRLGL